MESPFHERASRLALIKVIAKLTAEKSAWASASPVSEIIQPEGNMKTMTYRMLIAVVAIGLGADGLAAEKTDYPRISFSGPSQGKNAMARDEVIFLVVEGATLSHDASPIPGTDVVNYVNKLLDIKKTAYIGVYSREGTKYGDVVKAIDVLRGTNAKNISVSMVELAPGRVP